MSIENLASVNNPERLSTFVRQNLLVGTDARHNFRITSEVLEIGVEGEVLLETIATILPDYTQGLERLAALSMVNDKLRRTSPNFKLIRSIFGLNSTFNSLMETDRSRVLEVDDLQEARLMNSTKAPHPFVRLDLVIDSATNAFKCVEVEVDKLHGFGYATLCRVISPEPIGAGLANVMSQITADNAALFLSSSLDRFYFPEAKFFVNQVNVNGGNMHFQTQDEVLPGLEYGNLQGLRLNGNFGQLIQIPSFKGPSRLVRDTTSMLENILRENGVNLISSNRAGVADKSIMALLINTFGDEELESILHKCFESATLNTMRAILPVTILPMNKSQKTSAIDMLNNGEFFVKATNESGARGVIPPQRKGEQIKAIQNGNKVIIQEAVEPKFFELPFHQLGTGECGSDVFSMRVGVFYFDGNLTDVAVTASPGNVAHGGTSSIQMAAKRRRT